MIQEMIPVISQPFSETNLWSIIGDEFGQWTTADYLPSFLNSSDL